MKFFYEFFYYLDLLINHSNEVEIQSKVLTLSYQSVNFQFSVGQRLFTYLMYLDEGYLLSLYERSIDGVAEMWHHCIREH